MKQAIDRSMSTREWFGLPRFDGIRRLYTPEQVDEQRGSIEFEYPATSRTAMAFHELLRERFRQKRPITTFGPYSPGQAVTMKRLGIEGIYLGGWATSAKGSINEDPGPDLASYPLNQVPDEASAIVRALVAADRNQAFTRGRMSPAERAEIAEVDYRPFIIADADTGHGGEAHVRNLIRRFVEAGVPGYHIEDQKPGVKKCGHQAGKVLVAEDEQIKRLNSARFQLDVMRVAGLVVARTDAEAATLLDSAADERDHPFILGVTNTDVPCYKVAFLSVMRYLAGHGAPEVVGHLLYEVSEEAYHKATEWLRQAGVIEFLDQRLEDHRMKNTSTTENLLDDATRRFVDVWNEHAKLKTFGQAVADRIRFRIEEGTGDGLDLDAWQEFARTASLGDAEARAVELGVRPSWSHVLARTPEGFFQIEGGIPYAVAKSLAAAPYADLIWMETKTASLEEAREFAEAIHEVYPDKMLAYNLSPSFNWDTTGMSDEQMRQFPAELGKLGYVFNFITYGGHQIDGLAGEEFSTALKEDGMLALARLQRKLRLINSPYRAPQSYVGGPRSDAALMGCTGGTATTKSMGKGSTQFQHFQQTEVPPKLLESWLKLWTERHGLPGPWKVRLRPQTAGSDLLALRVIDANQEVAADCVFAALQDRRGRSFLSLRDENNHHEEYRRKRLMTLMHLFLIHRYKAISVHYISPSADTEKQVEALKAMGLYRKVDSEIGHITVAQIDTDRVNLLLDADQSALKDLIARRPLPAPAKISV